MIFGAEKKFNLGGSDVFCHYKYDLQKIVCVEVKHVHQSLWILRFTSNSTCGLRDIKGYFDLNVNHLREDGRSGALSWPCVERLWFTILRRSLILRVRCHYWYDLRMWRHINQRPVSFMCNLDSDTGFNFLQPLCNATRNGEISS